MWTRLLRTCASKPVSYSADFSGLRSALSGLLAVKPGVSFPVVELRPSMVTVPAEKSARPCVRPGCTPLAPYDRRSRRLSSQVYFGKNASSDSTHEALAFGYNTFWKFVPNALFWSERAATVRKRRSRSEACSCAYTPSVFVAVGCVSLAPMLDAAPTVEAPGGSVWPLLLTLSNSRLA